MMASNLEHLVSDIAAMDLDTLRQFWSKRYGPPPSLRSAPIMRMMLAWRIQAEALGGLGSDMRKVLSRSGAPAPEGRHLGVGARLTRNWKGRKVEIIVEAKGFRWEDELFPSLSAAATAITGSRWNGPRFFGLRDAQ